MELKNAKILGGIGTLLPFISIIFLFFLPLLSLIVSLVGFILVLIALKIISDVVNENRIFSFYIFSICLNIVGIILLFFGGVFSIIGGSISSIFSIFQGGLNIFSLFSGALLVVIFSWIIFCIASYFVKLSFDKISERINEKYFKTTGLLIFIGSILTIAFGIGAIISLVGMIFQAIAFFSLPEEVYVREYSPIPQPISGNSGKNESLPTQRKYGEFHIYLDNKFVNSYPVNSNKSIIGREGDIKTPETDNYVSRKQLEVLFDKNNKIFYLYLLPSKNPVYINEKRFGEVVNSPYILRDGDKIKIGARTTLIFKKFI
ncbi:MAG: DUF996 domain-containing protein [Caldisericia bacterium]|nr:DUF996 domain-containing protein [Caldisericia bacterium]